MSQAKVDQYKKEKHSRKELQKKAKTKKVIAYAISTIVAVIVVGWLGYSIAIEAGWIKPRMSDAEIESLRNVLIQNGDANVQTTVAEETTEVETTTVAE